MVVKIEGKEHRQGVSKAGRNYDFIVLHFLAKQRYVEGQAAVTKNVSSDTVDYNRILVGQFYDLEIDLSGNITGMRPAKA